MAHRAGPASARSGWAGPTRMWSWRRRRSLHLRGLPGRGSSCRCPRGPRRLWRRRRRTWPTGWETIRRSIWPTSPGRSKPAAVPLRGVVRWSAAAPGRRGRPSPRAIRGPWSPPTAPRPAARWRSCSRARGASMWEWGRASTAASRSSAVRSTPAPSCCVRSWVGTCARSSIRPRSNAPRPKGSSRGRGSPSRRCSSPNTPWPASGCPGGSPPGR